MSTILFENKKDCCGCGACMNICPKSAISLEKDEYGFLYPKIDDNKCVECNLCKTVCSFAKKPLLNTPLNVYAGVNLDGDQLYQSSSGGIFPAIASQFLQDNGVVVGSTMDFTDSYASIHHILIDSTKDLSKIQGSKYVQSSIVYTYKQTKDYLENGKKVLFSGTPCQIAGLKSYLGKTYENLWTIDIVCHGVSNEQFFDDFLQCKKDEKRGTKVIGYVFRDKKKGWGQNARIDILDENGKEKSYQIPGRLLSYQSFFLDGDSYRENCYYCPFAKSERISDLTLGDYWGFDREHPELLKKKEYDESKGISCILVNTEKGNILLNKYGNNIIIDKSTIEKVRKNNKQLNKPIEYSKRRDKIMSLYAERGYEAVDQMFKNDYKFEIMKHRIYNLLPSNIRKITKHILKK